MNLPDNYISTLESKMATMGELTVNYAPPLKARRAFVIEATERINEERTGKWKKLSEQRIAIMVNFMIPRGASDSFIHDMRKECQVAKNYSKKFWWLYKQARNGIIK